MAERTEMPDSGQLAKLFRLLLGPEEEWDDAAAEIVLELHGVDPAALDDDLRERLEREVEGRRSKGEEVPQSLLDAIASLRTKAESEEETSLDPSAWIDNLLSGIPPDNLTGPGQHSHLQSFRSRNMKPLTEEDRQILESLAAELKSEMEEEE